jgi:tRNA nucleotidyltransferase (CCA-adding enzyme)
VTWQTYEHEADVGVEGEGPTPAAAFEQAAVALTATVTEPSSVRERECAEVECHAPDLEILLVDWLNALIWEMATRRLLFARYEVVIEESPLELRLTGRAWGEAVSRERHAPAVEPKGATFTTLSVRRRDDGTWTARTVVDI